MALRQRISVRRHALSFPGKAELNAPGCWRGSENEPPGRHPFLGCVLLCAGERERVAQVKRNPLHFCTPLPVSSYYSLSYFVFLAAHPEPLNKACTCSKQ